MKLGALRLLAPALALLGCDGGERGPKNGDPLAGDLLADIGTARMANAAAAPAIRAAGDCEAVRSAAPEALHKLEELAAHVRTDSGRTTLEALRKRVHEIADTCP